MEEMAVEKVEGTVVDVKTHELIATNYPQRVTDICQREGDIAIETGAGIIMAEVKRRSQEVGIITNLADASTLCGNKDTMVQGLENVHRSIAAETGCTVCLTLMQPEGHRPHIRLGNASHHQSLGGSGK